MNNPDSFKSSEAPLSTQSPIVLNPEVIGGSSPVEDVVDIDNSIVIESDDADKMEITSAMCSADDSVIYLGSVVTLQSPFPPTEGIEVISKNLKHPDNSYQQSLPSILPSVFIVDQSTSLDPPSEAIKITSSASSSLYSHSNSVPSPVCDKSRLKMSETAEDNILLLKIHSPNLLFAILKQLIIKNENQMEKFGWHMVQYPTSLITAVFEICDRYKKNRFIKYYSVEIMMRYLSVLNIKLQEIVSGLEVTASLNMNDRNDSYLQIFTSVRIADKLHSMYKHMTSEDMVNALQEYGIPTTITRIKKLERDMLKTINFDINFVVIPEYLEVLILSLHLLFHIPQRNIEILKMIAIELLDTIYPHIESLYQKMWECISKEGHGSSRQSMKKYNQLTADYFNLAIAMSQSQLLILTVLW